MEDVRAIVNRAVKDLQIEQSLKTYEEIWLSKIFVLRSHNRGPTDKEIDDNNQDGGVRLLLSITVLAIVI